MDWKSLARDFKDKWNVQNCVGSLVKRGYVVDITAEFKDLVMLCKTEQLTGLNFIMYSLVDANYRFYNGGIAYCTNNANNCAVAKNFAESIILDPFPESHSVAAADGFPKRKWLRLQSDELDDETNFEISRALLPGDIAHDILYARFGVLKTNINVTSLWNIMGLIRAIKTLHNYFLDANPAYAAEYSNADKLVDELRLSPRANNTDDVKIKAATCHHDDPDKEWMEKIHLDEYLIQHLLERVAPNLRGYSNNFDPDLLLCLLMRYFATGYIPIGLDDTVADTISAIGESLVEKKDKVILFNWIKLTSSFNYYVFRLQLPFPVDKWMKIASGFKEKLNLPNCVGVLAVHDISEYIDIFPLGNFARKKVIVTAIDAKCRILFAGVCEHPSILMMINVPTNFNSLAIEEVLEATHINLPEANGDQPYVFVGDKGMQNLRQVVVPRKPGKFTSTQLATAAKFGEKVVKKIVKIFCFMTHTQSPRDPLQDPGAFLIFLSVHNYMMDNSPNYAAEFQDL